ncbi:hypothetical protein LSAT2_011951 [Lamellibrachia satsuma]|nr:hypothetical protein LSAT2_011951 [Lamellibrachia satsuma]
MAQMCSHSNTHGSDVFSQCSKPTDIENHSKTVTQTDTEHCTTLTEIALSGTKYMSCNDSGIVLDDTHNDTSIMSFFEESSLPVYPETDEKMAVVNGISNRGGTSHNNSTSHGDSVSHGNSMTREDSTEVYEALANGEEEKSRDKETVAEETVAMATEDTSLVPNFVEVKIVEGSEGNEEEVESGETQEEEIGESGEAQTTEEEAVQFIRGMTCTDITTALLILKTKYKLTDVATKKAILTWSCWNLTDMIHTPDETFWWWSSNKVPGLGNTHSLELAEHPYVCQHWVTFRNGNICHGDSKTE